MMNGVPVVAAPAEVDIAITEELSMVLLRAGANRPATIVVDMTRTRFCDSAGLAILVRAHLQALADDGELRLVVPPGGAVSRILAITGLDQVISLFGSLDEALAPPPAAAIRGLRPHPSAGLPGPSVRQSGRGGVSWWLRTGWRHRSRPGAPGR
jgi:anti-sigma B factor antagonist